MRRAASVFVYCDGNERVDAIEFSSPGYGEPGDDQVTFRGIDLFAETAENVLAGLRSLGVEMSEAEAGCSYTANDLVLSLWRDGGPSGIDELPTYFESALIALPGYYD